MRFNGQDSGGAERKIKVGTRPVWPWRAPIPITGAAPHLTFSPASGDVDIALGRMRDDDAVDGISADRKTLTKAAGDIAAGSGTQGERWGQAFLLTAGDGWHEIQVERITAGGFTLAHPLPRNVIITSDAPAVVQWRHHAAQVPEGLPAIETSTAGAVRWCVAFTGMGPAGIGALVGQEDVGIVHIVDRIFAPRVDIVRLSSPGLVGQKPKSRDSWDGDIDAAHADLVRHIRSHYSGERREDSLDPGRFVWALLRLTTSRILERRQPEESVRQAREAYRLADAALRNPPKTQPGAITAEEGGVDMSTIGTFSAADSDDEYIEPDF